MHIESMSGEELVKRITRTPGICHGQPCIRGLRYPVDMILELRSGGMSDEEILSDYPDLQADDLRAVYAYAARISRLKATESLAA